MNLLQLKYFQEVARYQNINIVNLIFTKNAVFNFTNFVSLSHPIEAVYPLLCKKDQQY